MRQAVILAGGKGTRLRERLGDLPKPLIDIGGVPLLERQILLLKKYEFTHVLILVNYQAEKIIAFCNDKNNWGLSIECIDDGEAAGTSGAVLRCLDRLHDEFLVIYGDTMLEVDLNRFYLYHSESKNTAATLFLHPNDHPYDSDLIELDDSNYIREFFPYPHSDSKFYPNLVNAALYWIRKEFLNCWVNKISYPSDFAKDLFPKMVSENVLLRGYNSPEYIKDCGTPDRVDKVTFHLKNGKIEKSSLSSKQKAIFIDRDGTLNFEVSHLSSVDELELIPDVAKSIKKINDSDYRSIVITNQPVIARGDCTIDELNQIHYKLETLLGKEGAFFDRIYYCPHHPEKGFSGEIRELKIKCECRKPNVGMINKAVDELNISLNDSWLIGDSTTDIQTAKNANLKSILVQSGYGGLDEKYFCYPDFIVPNFNAAVRFILDEFDLHCDRISSIAKCFKNGEIIYVGGQSRSGKSSFASILKILFEKAGKKCHVISTDSWLLNENERGYGVIERHNKDEILNVINKLQNRESQILLNIPFYKKSKREQIPDIFEILVDKEDIIIIEGVVALYFAKQVNGANRLFVKIDEQLRKKRVLDEYLMRGYSKEQALDIYNIRFNEEVPWVNNTAIDARHFEYFI